MKQPVATFIAGHIKFDKSITGNHQTVDNLLPSLVQLRAFPLELERTFEQARQYKYVTTINEC